eukprot:439222-Pelagomonas_calceolata.AAC.1
MEGAGESGGYDHRREAHSSCRSKSPVGIVAQDALCMLQLLPHFGRHKACLGNPHCQVAVGFQELQGPVDIYLANSLKLDVSSPAHRAWEK